MRDTSCLTVLLLCLATACSLNPQPEPPVEAAGGPDASYASHDASASDTADASKNTDIDSDCSLNASSCDATPCSDALESPDHADALQDAQDDVSDCAAPPACEDAGADACHNSPDGSFDSATAPGDASAQPD